MSGHYLGKLVQLNAMMVSHVLVEEMVMGEKLLLLPNGEFGKIRLVRVPVDLDEHEAFRNATGVIASVEEGNPNYSLEDIEDALEEHGFQLVDYILGPELA